MYYLISMNLLQMSMFLFFFSINMFNNKINTLMEFIFLNLNSLKFELIIYIDWMSLMFISTVFLISSMMIIYSTEYMKLELNINRFMKLVIVFIMSMMFMIICPNMISILLGWDGLGLSSYCLVIYYQNMKSSNSGLITILMNRVGDICILMSISLMIYLNNWNFMMENKKLSLILSLMLFIAAITKSAQIPFSSWLPLAMAAPTPVSALVHSSTLVTAGIYLMIRFNKILNHSIISMMMYMSMFTMFIAGLNANFEYDLKKIIALSTLSQLGLMFFILSFNLPKLSFFHLITHAMFKSLLFLSSGILIHNNFDNQDIRIISINFSSMKLNTLIFNLASMALCGIPFLTGFYSKDLIIEMFNMKNNNMFLFFILYFSMLLTILYTLRLIYFSSLNFPKNLLFNMNELKNLMYKSIIILIINSMILGSIMSWLMFSSINLIFLSFNNKMIIFYNFLFMLPFFYFLMKLKFLCSNIKIYLLNLLNYFFFLNLIYKKNKINIMKYNFKMIKNLDTGWFEYMIIYLFMKKIYKFFLKLNKMSMFKILLLSILFYLIMMI